MLVLWDTCNTSFWAQCDEGVMKQKFPVMGLLLKENQHLVMILHIGSHAVTFPGLLLLEWILLLGLFLQNL